MSKTLDLAIIGAGPCGIAAAISAQRAGLSVRIFEAQSVVSTIAAYPYYVSFFSTAAKLALGNVPFVVAAEKPNRRDALAYYRAIVTHFELDVRQYERVERLSRKDDVWTVHTTLHSGVPAETEARSVVVATGYFGSPNKLGVPGEDLSHVKHVYREGHEAFGQQVIVVGGGNSAAEAALDLWRAGAHVTLVHFGPAFDKRIKPWVQPDFENRVKEGAISVCWNSRVTRIEPELVVVRHESGGEDDIAARFVYVMTGFAPNTALLRDAGVPIDAGSGIPAHNPETLETPEPGLFIAGVVVAGFDANKVFIENGRFHGDKIVAHLLGQSPPLPPRLSAELDS